MNINLPPTTPVTPVDWFRRMPNGGTFFVDQASRRGRTAAPSIPVGHTPTRPVAPVDWFRRMPGGGTFFIDQAGRSTL